MGWGYYSEYIPVAKRKEKAEQKIKQLQKSKKYQDIAPVVVEGRTITKSWWGKSWCRNLEQYSDYSNRIGRGKSYVRHGSVIDLKISKGKIESLVTGSRSTPYKCIINIETLSENHWDKIKECTLSEFDSLQALLSGKFPKEMQEILCSRETGLFPSPKQINFNCTCPDWASMCKHIAATLYGVGVRLDAKPELFFLMRGVEMQELVTETIGSHKISLIDRAQNAKSHRILSIGDSPLGSMFNIDFNS